MTNSWRECMIYQPSIRSSQNQATELVEAYNRELSNDGWQIIETKQISGRSVYAPQDHGERVQIFEEP